MAPIILRRAGQGLFETQGAQLFTAALDETVLAVLDGVAAALPPGKAGVRLTDIAALQPLLSVDGPVGAIAASALGSLARPVRAVLFDKTPDANWSVGWHQDRTIAVRARVDTPGYGPWSVKAGLFHVQPPFDLLAGMVTLRVHLDPVGPDNAPLLIAPGSHRLGRIPEADIVAAVARCGTAMCPAARGDIWLYATPILHSSVAAAIPTHRRVLQVDYAAEELPEGLAWLGV